MINLLEELRAFRLESLVCGIDPGVSGAVCVMSRRSAQHVEYIYLNGSQKKVEMLDVVSCYRMPDSYEEYAELLEVLTRSVSKIFIEAIPKTVGVNRSSAKMYTLFVNYGLAVGALEMAKNVNIYSKSRTFFYAAISPQKWMGFVKNPRRPSTDYKTRKRTHLEITKELWPEYKWNDQFAEAPLIALAGNMLYP